MAQSICPAILIAAPASGQGKTTVTAALARLHARQGRRVRVFKCGPDFLDPFWHTMASGSPVYQLDLWMTGEQDCRNRLAAAAAQADLVIVEGVMGLFDGTPSAADLAKLLGIPVLAVVDASAMAGTFGALAFGLQHYLDDLPWAGVLANRVASAGHAEMLKTSLKNPSQWMGALMRDEGIKLPERHLGLTVASEVSDGLQRLDLAADALATTPLGQMTLQDLGRWSVNFGPCDNALPPADPACGDSLPNQQRLAGVTIAVARDAAFCFIYSANLDCLEHLGARLKFFSPLQDAALPDCDALWLPGGYPELHARTLADNGSLRNSLQQHVAAGKPVWAECGGMMALFDTLVTASGEEIAQWGVLPGRVTMHKRLAGLGPQQLALPGGTLRGHTFHYSTTESVLTPLLRTQRPHGVDPSYMGEAVWQQGSVMASYFHAWFASCPDAAADLFAPRTVACVPS
ncbi:cobyrinic acid a,c-diamide synthase [Rhodoferax lacus]|uniref:Cobyrinic acid a,c-diamide synthase n=1 Tax=Rhodoferax lacus TaxID=2184758 RepID=A0A3E1RDX7_9BURK|nr:cobyrinate a,c-diamide synthase [Rhodoferax lacus]RFO97574.1 cobyrinic acid a,c-diamide synthase [Rhodoferax lacus]